ncbi:transcription elongation factor GreAB [Pseudoalteromonas sp. G4]|uniref:transcription elongation factor GreAB n=1 Tax=Pseudoalteromonas sp. G4 TaxID=2992761 RepID=UPI00237E1A74|nr:transcription elongation factor GreAB [Pseudoalteromonas sp. G4]MDE3273259.1 transcription elongation factor GreAB [Pseudoalteromonas sp. G4]
MINKQQVVGTLILQLENSLNIAVQSAKNAHQDATHEQSKAETQYDSLGIEMAYLAEGQSKRIESLRQEIQALKETQFPNQHEQVKLGHLVHLIDCQADAPLWVFILPVAGGNKVVLGDVVCQIVTPSAPIAKKLLKQFVGDEIRFDWLAKEYEIYELI